MAIKEAIENFNQRELFPAQEDSIIIRNYKEPWLNYTIPRRKIGPSEEDKLKEIAQRFNLKYADYGNSLCMATQSIGFVPIYGFRYLVFSIDRKESERGELEGLLRPGYDRATELFYTIMKEVFQVI